MTWAAVGVATVGAFASTQGSSSKQKSGPTTSDITRARARWAQQMMWASKGLFKMAGTTAENRKKSAKKLFQLQDIGMQEQENILGQGYANAQNRMGLTTMAMRNARLGLAPDDRYLNPNMLDANLQPLMDAGIAPDLQFTKAPAVPGPVLYGDNQDPATNSLGTGGVSGKVK